jgi:hypothetical protein
LRALEECEAISISTKNNIVGATLVVAQNNKRGRVKPCPYSYEEIVRQLDRMVKMITY